MDKNRFEILKEIVYLDQAAQHIQSLFSVDDLKWLIEQAEKIEQVEGELISHSKSIFDLEKNIEELQSFSYEQAEKIIRYEKALKFYANRENYEEWNEDLVLTEYIHNVDFDGGETAKMALNKTEEDEYAEEYKDYI